MEGPQRSVRGRARGRAVPRYVPPEHQQQQKPQPSTAAWPNASGAASQPGVNGNFAASQPGVNVAASPGVNVAATQHDVNSAASQPQTRPIRGRGRGAPRPQGDATAVQQALENMTINDPPPGTAGDMSPPLQVATSSRGSRRQGPVPAPTRLIISGENGKKGSKGDIEPLKSNYFEFQSLADFTLYQYRVDFLPDPDVTSVKKGLLSAYKDELGAYMFDGTVLFTMTRVDENRERVSVLNRTQEQVRVVLKLTRDLTPSDPEYIQFLNIVIRRVLGLMDWKIVNRDYWDPSKKVAIPQHKLEIWPGYSTSIRQHDFGILLNVELGSKVMRQATAYSLLYEVQQRSPDYKEAFKDSICGTIVITPYNNQTYKIDDVDWNSNPNTTFDMRGTQVSFIDYYRSKYNLNVKYPGQPLLVSNPSPREIRSGRNTIVKLIPELCNLTGIDDAMRNNFTLMRAIAAHTKVAPHDRVQRIERGFLGALISKQDTNAELKRWNIKLNPSIVSFQGRRLPPETIYIGGDERFPADQSTGDFTQPLVRRRKPLQDLPRLQNWAVLFPKRISGQEVDNFVQTLTKASSSFHFMLPPPKMVSLENDKSNSYVQAIENVINEKAQLVMCVVPGDNQSRYADIKRKCYVNRSIPSQVVLGKNVAKANMSVCTKIGIQLACKMGGSPWTVKIPSWKNVMIAGFDVCHDTNQKGKSFGALVTSLNDNQTRYASFVHPHTSGEEISPFVPMMMEKAVILRMKEDGNTLPSKIIFYRDGVGEGNFNYVMDQEVQQIIKHLQKLYGDKTVPLVYIVVTKRINTRLFRANDNGNPLPGTIADSCVTNPSRYDFFLVSQSVREGTVAPTYYVVLHDAISIKPDHVQQLTYKMCHMYFNWSGTIRVPAPVQYAHKLAFLIGQHLHTVPTGAEQSMGTILYYL